MKIYVYNHHINKINEDNIKQYLTKTTEKNVFYSNEGIFKITNNKLYKIQVKDVKIKNHYINNIKCYIDNSEHKLGEEYYQIPYTHVRETITEEIYKLKENSDIKLILEKLKGFINNIYFETKLNINTIGIKEEILSFLSVLKFGNRM